MWCKGLQARLLIIVFMLTILPFIARSSERENKDRCDILKAAEVAWAGRINLVNTLRAMDLYEQAAAMDPNDIQSRLMVAEAAWWAVELDPDMDKKEQIDILNRGINAAEQALKIEPGNPAAHNWRMWDLAAKTIAEGIFRGGFAFKEAIIGTIMVSKGDADCYYGAIYSYWARVIYTLPGLLGKFFHFTEDDAITFYQKALEVEPNFFKTRYYLAESLLKKEDTQSAKAEFRYIVDTPAAILPEREPENLFYQAQVKKHYSRYLENQ